jgi:hypothetical protein
MATVKPLDFQSADRLEISLSPANITVKGLIFELTHSLYNIENTFSF